MQRSLRHHVMFAAAASHSGAIGLLYGGPRPFVPGKAEVLTDVAGWGRGGGPIIEWIRSLFGTDLATWRAYDVVELVATRGGAMAGGAPGAVALYIDCGTEDDFGLHDNARYVDEALTQLHIEHEFFLGPGRHDFKFWSARVPASLAFLQRHTARPQ
jgi:S-formylglutathione hydrolase FrmB